MNMDAPDQFHFVSRRLVEFADTDLAGIMHFANFLRFAESAEHAYFRSLGHTVHGSASGVHHGWPRIEVSCKYHRPARFEQTLATCLRIEEIRSSSLRYGFWTFLADDPARPLLAQGSCAIIHVTLDPAGGAMRKAPVPPALRHLLERAPDVLLSKP
jgi:YbgC/YbaW family acyl-CoA thioester hydrolase